MWLFVIGFFPLASIHIHLGTKAGSYVSSVLQMMKPELRVCAELLMAIPLGRSGSGSKATFLFISSLASDWGRGVCPTRCGCPGPQAHLSSLLWLQESLLTGL